MSTHIESEVPPAPGRAIQIWSFALPVLKCAACPACLSVLSSVFAGARMGFLGDDRLHGGIIATALVVDLLVLRAALVHHGDRGPLILCIVGGIAAVLGHIVSEPLEYAGFAVLMLAALRNVFLLRRHRADGGPCCAHDAHRHGRNHAAEHA